MILEILLALVVFTMMVGFVLIIFWSELKEKFFALTDNYLVAYMCKNCNKQQTLAIPKGTTIEKYLNDNEIKCNTCGCLKHLKRNNISEYEKQSYY